MAECNITSVQVLNNPAPFTDPIVLEVQYECLSSLKEDLEWRVVYVGSAEGNQYDQVLDSAMVGPVQQGLFKFRMEAPAPDPSKIPVGDLVGMTVLLLTCSYKGHEFVQVGYYVTIEYTDPELLDPDVPKPNPPQIDKLQRTICADTPRVTKFPHDFDNEPAPLPEPGAEGAEAADEELLDDELLLQEGDDEGDEYEEYEEDDEEEDAMGEEGEVDLEVENQDPNGAQAAALQLQGKAGLAAAVGAVGAAVDEMEL